VTLIANDRELSLRWPAGDLSPLLPIEPDHFIDRSYWQNVTIERDHAGETRALVYDRFRGTASRLQLLGD
jgi:hypothetical protein